ncbi:MAG: hypothetical protein IK122_02430, partial [Alphaproteobacteria bacterium]|nr:hypothetical protein [Alphaproteobacteria bacterium]
MKKIWFLVAGVVLVLGIGAGLVLGTGKNVQNPVDNGEINTDINDGTEEQDEALIVNDDESDFVFEYMTLDEYKNDWGMNYYDSITFYEGEEDIAIIVGVKDNAMKSDVVIPSFVVEDGVTYRVGAIAEEAFAVNVRDEFVHVDYIDGEEWEGEQRIFDNNTIIKSVTIPATLDFVEWSAFWGCVAVEKIYIKERSTPFYGDFFWDLIDELVA